jgi:retron-type reverse transcriptase
MTEVRTSSRFERQALVQKMEPIFEPLFADCSFGYRPGRSPHTAMRKVWCEINQGNLWILDADLRSYFGASGQAWRFQRVQFPPRQGERAAPPGIEPWAHGGNNMG